MILLTLSYVFLLGCDGSKMRERSRLWRSLYRDQPTSYIYDEQNGLNQTMFSSPFISSSFCGLQLMTSNVCFHHLFQ